MSTASSGENPEGRRRVPVAPVSVVIPCFRCTETIERAVESVARQSVRPTELILVDDACDNGTPALLDAIRTRYGPDWIRIVRLPENLGPASARNAGWERASQKYVAFLDSDDAWHPEKIKIQWAWMEAHPEVAVTGHASVWLDKGLDAPRDPGGGDAIPISRMQLLASNRFITPSVMVHREIPHRFEPGKRHMEDYLLWLEIASSGLQLVKLPYVLAYTYKAPFGAGGLSAQAWRMEKGELHVFRTLLRKGLLGPFAVLMLSGFSLGKFLRRLLMMSVGYNPNANGSMPSWGYSLAYLLLTQSMTALMIGVGLLGQSVLAADIGIVQGAALATFFALSGNARNLILNLEQRVSTESLLANRVVVLLPLMAGAFALSEILGTESMWFTAILIIRKGGEWIAEVELTVSERANDPRVAARSNVLQSSLLVFAMLVFWIAPAFAGMAIALWAIVPFVPTLRWAYQSCDIRMSQLRQSLVGLATHYGSTAASGWSIYAFRALLILVAGKVVAGDLFVTFAIGSFLGTLFANVVGPTVHLHEQRIGRPALPGILWGALIAYFVGGVGVLALTLLTPSALLAVRDSSLFWTSLGWSLLGGGVMLIAQRQRLRLISKGEGAAVFAPDLLMHIGVVASVPALYAIGDTNGLSLLYLVNTILALAFYWTSEAGIAERLGDRVQKLVPAALVFLIFFPLFFLIKGAIFNPTDPVSDSGGTLHGLPLPISVIAAYGGLLLMGGYRNALGALWTILALLIFMLLSAIAVSEGASGMARPKMLMMVQILLPSVALALGLLLTPWSSPSARFSSVILAVVAIIVPAQIAASWWKGNFSLTHSLGLFSVYQHWQYVPSILACGFVVALPSAWVRARRLGKMAIAALFALLGCYVVAAYSMLATAVVLAGAIGFGGLRLARGRETGALIMSACVVASVAVYIQLVQDTAGFQAKFRNVLAGDGTQQAVVSLASAVANRFGSYRVYSIGDARAALIRISVPQLEEPRILEISGQLELGALVVGVEDVGGSAIIPIWDLRKSGAFSMAFKVPPGNADLFLLQDGTSVDAYIDHIQWKPSGDANSPNPRPHEQMIEVPNVAASYLARVKAGSGVEPWFGAWRIKSGLHDLPELMKIERHVAERAATLEVEGHLIEGGLWLGVERAKTSSIEPLVRIENGGPFHINVPVPKGSGEVLLFKASTTSEAIIRWIRWRKPLVEAERVRQSPARSTNKVSESVGIGSKPRSATLSPATDSLAQPSRTDAPSPRESLVRQAHDGTPETTKPPAEPLHDIQFSATNATSNEKSLSAYSAHIPMFQNLLERLADWRLFGSGILESPRAFLFGHNEPLPRDVRTSAHNFYLDLVYNFGTLSLAPILVLIVYTTALLLRYRRHVSEVDDLLFLAAVVAYLVLFESNFKVLLRQPYPGIAAYLLWGVLIGRLQRFRNEGA